MARTQEGDGRAEIFRGTEPLCRNGLRHTVPRFFYRNIIALGLRVIDALQRVGIRQNGGWVGIEPELRSLP